MGSNHRSAVARQIYSLLPLTTRPLFHASVCYLLRCRFCIREFFCFAVFVLLLRMVVGLCCYVWVENFI